MKTHEDIDLRSLRLAQAIVDRIDGDPERRGLDHAREVCRRWCARDPSCAGREWLPLLDLPWDEVRRILLDPSEEGRRLRQSSPFCGILDPRARWAIYREFHRDAS